MLEFRERPHPSSAQSEGAVVVPQQNRRFGLSPIRVRRKHGRALPQQQSHGRIGRVHHSGAAGFPETQSKRVTELDQLIFSLSLTLSYCSFFAVARFELHEALENFPQFPQHPAQSEKTKSHRQLFHRHPFPLQRFLAGDPNHGRQSNQEAHARKVSPLVFFHSA